MDIDVERHAGYTLVRLRGRLVDGEPASSLQQALEGLVRDQEVNTVIDVENVTWFDSLGVGLLISHYISMHQRGGQVLLLKADDKILTLMKLARLTEHFGWPADMDEVAELLERAP